MAVCVLWGDDARYLSGDSTVDLTPSTPAVTNCCCWKGSAPYCSNPGHHFQFLTFGRSGAYDNATAPKCQKLTSSSAMAERPRELDQRFQMGVVNLRLLWIEELLFAPLPHDAIIYAYASCGKQTISFTRPSCLIQISTTSKVMREQHCGRPSDVYNMTGELS